MSTLEITNQLLHLNPKDKDYLQKRMKLRVQFLQQYLATYDDQYGYENYTDAILINDILYGLGVAINAKEHQYVDGYEVWKGKLRYFLSNVG